MPTTLVPFSATDIETLLEEGWEAHAENFYVKTVIVQLGCGCCSNAETHYLTKLADGTYSVSYFPLQGSSEHYDTAVLKEALNYF